MMVVKFIMIKHIFTIDKVMKKMQITHMCIFLQPSCTVTTFHFSLRPKPQCHSGLLYQYHCNWGQLNATHSGNHDTFLHKRDLNPMQLSSCIKYQNMWIFTSIFAASFEISFVSPSSIIHMQQPSGLLAELGRQHCRLSIFFFYFDKYWDEQACLRFNF